ncbi:MAG: hypothetical protein ACHQ50_02960 [Fimbriimonadales bacterium]
MGLIGRLFLATLVFLAQVSFGQAVCVCPPAPIVAVEQADSVCPMKVKTGCPCCFVKKHPSRVAIGSPQKCQIGAAKSLPAKLEAVVPLVDIPALPLALSSLTSGVRNEESPVRPHLVVPRIRPPNPRLHGLRAPPAR